MQRAQLEGRLRNSGKPAASIRQANSSNSPDSVEHAAPGLPADSTIASMVMPRPLGKRLLDNLADLKIPRIRRQSDPGLSRSSKAPVKRKCLSGGCYPGLYPVVN